MPQRFSSPSLPTSAIEGRIVDVARELLALSKPLADRTMAGAVAIAQTHSRGRPEPQVLVRAKIGAGQIAEVLEIDKFPVPENVRPSTYYDALAYQMLLDVITDPQNKPAFESEKLLKAMPHSAEVVDYLRSNRVAQVALSLRTGSTIEPSNTHDAMVELLQRDEEVSAAVASAIELLDLDNSNTAAGLDAGVPPNFLEDAATEMGFEGDDAELGAAYAGMLIVDKLRDLGHLEAAGAVTAMYAAGGELAAEARVEPQGSPAPDRARPSKVELSL